MEEATKVERKNSFKSRKGDFNQSSGTIDSNVHYKCISVAY